MDKYKYSIQLRYIKKKENISQEIKSTRIRSVIIDKDYSSNNLPVIFMNITLQKDLLDHMIHNSQKNTMVLTIYKYIYNITKSTSLCIEMLCHMRHHINIKIFFIEIICIFTIRI